MMSLRQKGESCDFDEIARDIKERDERDMTREIAPLKKCRGCDLSRQFGYDD